MKMQAKKLKDETPYIPAEWKTQAVLWTAWPSHPDLWLEDLEPARAEVAAMIKLVSKHQAVKVLAMGDEAQESAQEMLGDAVEVLQAKFGDIWLRDTGPIFNAAGIALRFQTNGWGGKYDLPHDNTVGDELAALAGAQIKHHDFILEGGAVEHNGAGTILTTRQCVLNPNRNPGWDEAAAEAALKQAFSAQRICWLDEGLLNDHTDGHIDNIARFIDENHVVCQSAFGEDDPNATLYEKIAADLRAMDFEVTQIPSPGKVMNEDGDIVPASHVNFIIANGCVAVPTYGTVSADEAVEQLSALFPGREVIGLPSMAILSGGGSFHCITQQEPSQ